MSDAPFYFTPPETRQTMRMQDSVTAAVWYGQRVPSPVAGLR